MPDEIDAIVVNVPIREGKMRRDIYVYSGIPVKGVTGIGDTVYATTEPWIADDLMDGPYTYTERDTHFIPREWARWTRGDITNNFKGVMVYRCVNAFRPLSAFKVQQFFLS